LVELHSFVDASQSSYAAVAYFRFIRNDRVSVAFISSKAKVAPTKTQSIPRLELQAALLGARLADNITRDHNITINNQIMWSDSKVVLSWIRSTTKSFRQFVAVRKGEINELTTISEWFYVPSKLNTADIATKWTDGSNINDTRWYNGPEFLLSPQHEWPKENSTPIHLQHDEEVLLLHESSIVDLSFSSINELKFSNWRRLVRCIAYVQRFIAIKTKLYLHNCSSFLTSVELSKAEELIIRKAQHDVYSTEVLQLLKKM
jgi:hypothetical protein